MQPMVSKMLGADGVTAGSVLLVDSVNNRTNGSLNAAEATETLRNALANNGKFTLVSAQQLSMAKQQLGLSPQDSLGTRKSHWALPAMLALITCCTPAPLATLTLRPYKCS